MMEKRQFDIRSEIGQLIVDYSIEKFKIPVRIHGSIAIAMQCPKYLFLWEKLDRKFPLYTDGKMNLDLDLIILNSHETKFKEAMRNLNFTTTNDSIIYDLEQNRLLFYPPNSLFSAEIFNTHLPIEVYFQKLELHHDIKLTAGLLSIDQYTLSITDLFLTRLQYDLQPENDSFTQAQINQFIDMAVILAEYQVSRKAERNAICATRIAKTLSQCSNVEFEITAYRNFREFKKFVAQKFSFDNELKNSILSKVDIIETQISKFPKTPVFTFKERLYARRKKLGRELYSKNQF